jgi:hypothetical protein
MIADRVACRPNPGRRDGIEGRAIVDGEDPRDAPWTGASEQAEVAGQPPAATNAAEVAAAADALGAADEEAAAGAPAPAPEPAAADGELTDAEPAAEGAEPEASLPPPAPTIEATLAAIQFKADSADLPTPAAAPAPVLIRSRVGDLPAGLAVPAAAVSLGFGLVLLGALLPMSQAGGKQPLLAIESVAGGLVPTAGYWFALGAVVAGFVGQLIAYPMLARRGRRFVWVLLLIAIGAAEAAGFAVARRSGISVSGDTLIAIPPVLGMAGGVLTALAGLVLGLVGSARDGVKCRECRAVLARESGFCPDCGAWLTEVVPTRSRLASGWHSGLIRGASSVVVLALAVAAVILLVLETAPQS